MKIAEIRDVLICINPCWDAQDLTAIRLRHEDDEEFYDVWKIESGQANCILKRTSDMEWEIYNTFFQNRQPYVPNLLGSTVLGSNHYLLLEYISGHSLQKCNRQDLTVVLNSMIAMQWAFWENTALAAAGYSYPLSLEERIRRGEYLNHLFCSGFIRSFLRFMQLRPVPCAMTTAFPLTSRFKGTAGCFSTGSTAASCPIPSYWPG